MCIRDRNAILCGMPLSLLMKVIVTCAPADTVIELVSNAIPAAVTVMLLPPVEGTGAGLGVVCEAQPAINATSVSKGMRANMLRLWYMRYPVSYTHLTLPTIYSV